MPRLLPVLMAALALPVLPAMLAGDGGGAWFHDDVKTQTALGEAVARSTHQALSAEAYHTGADLYDGEWWFGTYTMAAMGFGQLALSQPEAQEAWLSEMDHAISEATRPEVRAFDTRRWGEDPLAEGAEGEHVAYLGYLALPMALRAHIAPWEGDNEEVVEGVMGKLSASYQAREAGLLATYTNRR